MKTKRPSPLAQFKIALAQYDFHAGHIAYNEQKILNLIKKAKAEGVRLLIFPELALNGYPPRDFLYRKAFLDKSKKSVQKIQKSLPKNMGLLLGALQNKGGLLTNSAFYLQHGFAPKVFHKEHLADTQVFDEKRYFQKGLLRENIFCFQGLRLKVLICEDMWQGLKASPVKGQLKGQHPLTPKPDLIISLNASPFDQDKVNQRLKMAKAWTKHLKTPFIYLNMVGGDEELIFDGGSFALNPRGDLMFQGPFFKEELLTLNFPFKNLKSPGKKIKKSGKKNDTLEHKKQALVWGLRNFVEKQGFKQVHLGLSGGVDSALLATLAVLALGKKNVTLFFLPGPFTSHLSEKCAKAQAQHLKLTLYVKPITKLYQGFLNQVGLSYSLKSLKELKDLKHVNKLSLNSALNFSSTQKNKTSFKNSPLDLMAQNVQARLRSLFLMAYANRFPKSLLLGSANKSELALGYGSLYGDLAGGLLPLGDLFKTEVYALARYVNVLAQILKRPASAELRKDQKDEQDILPYKVLDPILKKLIEEGQDPKTLQQKQVFQQIRSAEFKRRQMPPILKVKNQGFDRGWRWPFDSNKES